MGRVPMGSAPPFTPDRLSFIEFTSPLSGVTVGAEEPLRGCIVGWGVGRWARGLSPDVWEALPNLWARLRAERRFELHAFEDTSRREEQRISRLASGVFVALDFPAGLLAETRQNHPLPHDSRLVGQTERQLLPPVTLQPGRWSTSSAGRPSEFDGFGPGAVPGEITKVIP